MRIGLARAEMGIKIRAADVDDSAGIAHVQVTSYRTAYKDFFPPRYFEQMTQAEQTQEWRAWLSDELHEPIRIAENEAGEIIGYAFGKKHLTAFEGFDSELVALHVLPNAQHNGIGSKLFFAIADELKTSGANSLMLWTIKENPVRAFYERLGGALIGEKSYDVDDMTVTKVAYGWKNMNELIEQLSAKQNGA